MLRYFKQKIKKILGIHNSLTNENKERFFMDYRRINNSHSYEILYKTISEINNKYDSIDRSIKKLVLGVTSGRSGMKWVYEIFRHHDNADGGGERNKILESFYRYVKFNKLPIDMSGVITSTKREILLDWIKSDISITVSPYFAHDFLNLIKKLEVDKVIWGINDPKFTITSFYNKGFYLENLSTDNHNHVFGFQTEFGSRCSHFFGRLIPSGDFYNEWKQLTRIGKISWFVNMLHVEIFHQVKKLSKKDVWVFKLEDADQNYEYYEKLANFFKLKPKLSKDKFLSLKYLAAKDSENTPKKWTKKETNEYLKYTKELRNIYENELNIFHPHIN